MTVSPPSNCSLNDIVAQLKDHSYFVISGHVSPDGDCLGSQLALASVLQRMGKTVIGVLAKDEPIDATLEFLPGINELRPASQLLKEGIPHFDYVFVSVDVPTLERLGDAAQLHARASLRIALDHHEADDCISEYTYVESDAASTTLLVWELLAKLSTTRTKEEATHCYVGLMTDTGGFRYQNANAEAFEKAAAMVAAGADPALCARETYQNRSRSSLELCALTTQRMIVFVEGQAAMSWVTLQDMNNAHAVKADAEPLVDILRSLRGVRVACILREQDDCIRGSLRAKDATDVSAIARRFGGGGHVAAAGFTLHMTMDEAKEQLMHAIMDALT